jgi:putative oxidoreductase
MALSRRIADPLLATTFLACGLDALRTRQIPSPATASDGAVGGVTGETAAAGTDPYQAVRMTGAVQMAAATLLASRRFTRLAALALLATVVPTTAGGRRFWTEDRGDTQDVGHRVVVRNIGLVGGLLLAALDRGGAPSLAWRVHRRVESHGATATGQPSDAGGSPGA